MSDLDACAVRPDGTLKDASEIEWVHSPTSNKTFPTLNDDIADAILDHLPKPLLSPNVLQEKNLLGM